MDTATALHTNDGDEVEKPGHFAKELFGLIARVIATAFAINVVLIALVLLLSGQAVAAQAQPAGALRTQNLTQATAERPCMTPSPRDQELMLLHRMSLGAQGGWQPVRQDN
ncbi:hypothetical protein ACKVEX_14630 [Rhodocyclaceae bacterium SMB388]